MSERVTISILNGIADVRFNRPEKRNALDGEQFLAIAAAGERLKSEPGVRCAVISGEGASFCAGLDFSSFQSMAGGSMAGGEGAGGSPADGSGQNGNPAAVHGHALGGGIQIALGADIRIVHPQTQMSVREVFWGLVPDMTGTFVLSRLVRPDVAKELTFTARVFSGEEAYALGLATRLSETPYDDAMALAAQIAGNSPDAVRGAKALFNGLVNAGAAEQFADERRVIGSLIGSPNQVECVMASFEKRQPAFVDAG